MNTESLIAVLTALGGFELVKWIVNLIVNWRNNKRKDASEADQKEIEADADEFHLYKERLEELRQANKELNEINLALIKAGAHKDDLIVDKTAKIRELNEYRVGDAQKIAKLEKQVMFYKAWFCKREFGNGTGECKRREPAQNPPLKFNPIKVDEP